MLTTIVNRLLGRPRPVHDYAVPAFDIRRDVHPGWLRYWVLGERAGLEQDD